MMQSVNDAARHAVERVVRMEDDRIRAANAETLRQDPTFQAAVLEARKDALEELARIEPVDIEAIRNAQAKVRAIDALTTALASFILKGMQRRNPAV